MFDTNEVKNSTPEARYKTSPESQLTISYSISKSFDICLGMRYLFTHKHIWNTVQTAQVQESYCNNFSTRQNLVMLGFRYNFNGQDKKIIATRFSSLPIQRVLSKNIDGSLSPLEKVV